MIRTPHLPQSPRAAEKPASSGNGSVSRRGGLLLPAVAVYAVALSIRLIFLAQAIDNPMLRKPVVDESINWEVAKVILNGDLRPLPYVRSPGYMYVLAGLAGLLGEESFLVRVAQVFLDALSAVFMYLIGLRAFGRTAGVLAGALGAVFWPCVFFSCQLLDTSLTCLLCLVLAYLLLRLPDNRWWKWLVCGLVGGMAATVRPNLLAVAPALALVLLAKAWFGGASPLGLKGIVSSRWRALARAFVQGVLLVSGSLLGLGPVTLRNRVVGGEWVPVCISGGFNLWIANRPGADGKDVGPALDVELDPAAVSAKADPWERCLSYQMGTQYARKHLGKEATHGQIDRFYYRIMGDHVRHHPWQFLANLLKRVCWTFNAYEFPNNKDLYEFCGFSSLLSALSYLHFGVVCPMALLGIGLALRPSQSPTTGLIGCVALVATLAATGTLFVVNARYRLPISALLLPFAAYATVWAVQRIRRPKVHLRALAAAAGACSVLGVFCNANLFGYQPDRRPVYLEWFFVCICHEVGDGERLREAMAVLGREMTAYVHSSRRGESMAELILRYQHPFASLVQYYGREGNWAEVRRYGDLMLREEPFDELRIRGYFTAALDAGRKEIVYELLQQIHPRLLERDRNLLGELYLRVGRRYADRQALSTARSIFWALTRERPSELRYHRNLDEARSLLASTGVSTRASEAATTSSRLPARGR